jgi:hypothetical protein
MHVVGQLEMGQDFDEVVTRFEAMHDDHDLPFENSLKEDARVEQFSSGSLVTLRVGRVHRPL